MDGHCAVHFYRKNSLMKKCPQCSNTYSDETLRFCLSDGTALVSADEQETREISSSERHEMIIDLSQNEPETVVFESAPVTGSIERKKSRAGMFIGGFVAAVILLSVVGMVALGIYYFAFAERKTVLKTDTSATSNSNIVELKNKLANLEESLGNSNTKTNSADNNIDELKKKIANLEGSLGNGNTKTNSVDNAKTPPKISTAVVNSPNDGFLALRTLPNHKTGKRIAKIPHGASISINSCRAKRVKIGKRTGRWCRVSYKGKSGWVFDAWLRR